ncbi:MAG: ATP-binding protein [Dehalococcoidales bacterium]|nr:ATP-binding protein [Dehalococcoidales bacterium]
MQLYLLLPPVISFVLSFSLAILVALREFKKPAYRLFVMFLVGTGLWALIVFAFRTSPDIEHATFWIQLLTPVDVFTCLVFWHFSVVHTRLKTPRWLPFAVYSFFLISVGFALADKVIIGVTTDQYGYLPITSIIYKLLSSLYYIFIVLGMVNFIRAYRRSVSYEERNSYLYFIVGVFLSVIGGTVDYLSIISSNVPPVGLVGNILFTIFATIATLKYRLLDVNIVIRKGVAYLLTSTVIALPIVGAIVLINQIVGQGNFTIWMYLVLLLLIAIGLQAIWLKMQNFVDRLFFRERYDFLKKLENFSREVHDISDLNKLGSSLVTLIGRALQTSSVQLFMATESGDFTLIASTGKDIQEIVFQNNSPLTRWMNKNKEILFRHQIDVTPQLQSLTIRERTDLANIGAELFIPLKTNKDELAGLLIVGKKRSEQPYSGEDIRRILTVSNRVAIELENARLYARETEMRFEMQRQNEQKTEFLHHVAHELKTPLTAIISSSELITSEGLTVNPEQKERLLVNINRSAWLMDKRVGELLDLARIQIGTLELKLEPVDMVDMVHDLTSQLSALFKNKEQTIETDIPESLPTVKADKERVEEILINLLSNANKFSPARGNITIKASVMRNMVLVEIKDSAQIISDEDRERIFNAYYRGGTEADRQRISGLGLGLAITKSLIELHHGEIGVKDNEGKGNNFYFSLPIWGIGEEKQASEFSALHREGD